MATNDKLKKNIWVRILLCLCPIILVISCVGMVFVFCCYSAEEIDSSQKFIQAIKHSAETGKAYDYVLTDSFEVDIADLPAEKCFYGHLNGNGYTVTLTSKDDRTMTSPIFSKIMDGAKVERLRIELDAVLGKDEDIADIAVLAKDNFGVIQDCSFSINKIFMGNKCRNAAALIINNFGDINSVCVDVGLVESSQSADNWQCAFGTITTTNYAVVKNAFVRVLFNKIEILDRLYNNQSVGYIFGKIGKEVSDTDIDSIHIFGDSSFWHCSADAVRTAQYEVVESVKPDSGAIYEFIHYNDHNENFSNAWSASLTDDKTGFPLLNK